MILMAVLSGILAVFHQNYVQQRDEIEKLKQERVAEPVIKDEIKK